MTDYQTYMLLQFLCWYPRQKFGNWYTTSPKLGVIRYLCKRGSLECPGMEALIQSRIIPGQGRAVLERWLNGELVYQHPKYQAIVDESQARLHNIFLSKGYLPHYRDLLDINDV
jgi:hypothetical protein